MLLAAFHVLQLVTSARLHEQAYSKADDSKDQGKCDLDSMEFYWAYDMMQICALSLGVLAFILAVWTRFGSVEAWTKSVACFNVLVGIICIFLPYIAGNLVRRKVVDRTCKACHCNPEERENLVNQAGLCLLFVMMRRSARVANFLGIFNVVSCCLIVCTRLCTRLSAKKGGSGTSP